MRNFCTISITTFALLMTSTASALLSDGLYKLNNHPDGGAQPPLYGLRLDGLDGGGGSRIFTFDFEDARSAMYMDLDTANSSIRIYGQVWGGRDIGMTYDPTMSGLWDVDFTYTMNIGTGNFDNDSRDEVYVNPDSPLNAGSITPLFTAGTFTTGNAILLTDKDNGKFAFQIDTNHRGAGNTYSGWGWMNHEVGGLDNHIAASDWLFTVGNEVPVPGAALLAALGLSLVGTIKRRFA